MTSSQVCGHLIRRGLSITGARYIHLQYGPVPENYAFFFAELERDRLLEIEEGLYDGYTGFRCIARTEPDLTMFDRAEVRTLELVRRRFENFGSVGIMKVAYEEIGYTSTGDGEAISYLYANSLKI